MPTMVRKRFDACGDKAGCAPVPLFHERHNLRLFRPGSLSNGGGRRRGPRRRLRYANARYGQDPALLKQAPSTHFPQVFPTGQALHAYDRPHPSDAN